MLSSEDRHECLSRGAAWHHLYLWWLLLQALVSLVPPEFCLQCHFRTTLKHPKVAMPKALLASMLAAFSSLRHPKAAVPKISFRATPLDESAKKELRRLHDS